MELDFEIDKITESIEDAMTGACLETHVLPVLTAADLNEVTKKNGWHFDWKTELAEHGRHVYKLVTEKEPNIIQGLISFEIDKGFVFMNLIESSPFNLGRGKKYLGVAGNLVAYVCKSSLERGFGGVVAFEPKTALIDHYAETLGAVSIGNKRMAIFEEDATILIDKYFPENKEKKL